MPTGHISERFSHLETGKREVVVIPCITWKAVDNLHEQLKKNDTLYSSAVVPLKEHLKKLPSIVAFMDTHVVSTPYSFPIRKCDVVSCCGQIRSPRLLGLGTL